MTFDADMHAMGFRSSDELYEWQRRQRPAQAAPVLAVVDRTAEDTAIHNIKTMASLLVADAERAWLVLSSEQVPLKPLAMGNYKTVVTVTKKFKRQ